MKTLIISHKADIDGLSPVIFLKLFRENVDICLLNANDIIPKVKELTTSKEYKNYDEIFITDLTLDRHACELIMQTGEYNKFHNMKIKSFFSHPPNVTSCFSYHSNAFKKSASVYSGHKCSST